MVTLFDDEYIQEAYEKELKEKERLKVVKENASSMYAEGLPLSVIAKCLKYPVEVVRGWLGLQPA